MTGPLDGKVALVTGGARGLGQAYARMLASRGAKVVVPDLLPTDETEAMVRDAGGEFLGVRADISVEQEVAALADTVEARFGRLDILVNNAGVSAFQPFEEISFDDWRRTMSVNVDGGFLMAKAFAPGMKARGWGRIVFVSSNTGWTNSPFFVHYIASKLAVVGLTRALASELGEHGITVNAIAPSLVRTPMTESSPARELYGKYAEMQAIHREETPEDLAKVVAFLASDDSAFVTGQTIAVDGGLIRL